MYFVVIQLSIFTMIERSFMEHCSLSDLPFDYHMNDLSSIPAIQTTNQRVPMSPYFIQFRIHWHLQLSHQAIFSSKGSLNTFSYSRDLIFCQHLESSTNDHLHVARHGYCSSWCSPVTCCGWCRAWVVVVVPLTLQAV